MRTWHHRAAIRIVAALIIGLAAGFGVGAVLGPAAGALAGWAVGALVAACWVLVTVWSMNPAQTRAHTRAEDPGRALARIIALVGSVASFVAVGMVLIESRSASGWQAWVLSGIAVVAVIASWALIQVDYMLRFAAMYYADPQGGIDFNEDDDPQYTDFAYLSVGLGMTYQVADTDVQSKTIRKVVIAQTLIAYLFGAVILGTVINLVTSIGS